MKLLHLSDLHLGKVVHGFSLLEDQKHILKQIQGIARDETPDAVLISGDVFDRSVAPTEALALFETFLMALASMDLQVFVISGNHDSAQRLSFAAELISSSGIHIAKAYDGTVSHQVLTDAYGPVDIFCLPFIRPAWVRRCFPDKGIESWTQAVAVALEAAGVKPERRSVLLAHQFVTGAETSESEELSVGGAENVDASVFDAFDYVALGHLHRPQQVGRETLRYCGSPLKYSFSEAGQSKSVTLVDLKEKGNLTLKTVALQPLRDLCQIRGTYLEVTDRSFYQELDRTAYFRITLTDEEDQVDAAARLRTVYPNLMLVDYDNTRTRSAGGVCQAVDAETVSPYDMFLRFYEEMNGQGLAGQQEAVLRRLIEATWEENL